MKKKVIICVIVIVCIIAICLVLVNNNKKDSKQNNLTQENTVESTSENTDETTVVKSDANSENELTVKYEGVDVTPGQTFDESKIDKQASKSTVTSCAFDGTDDVYTYDNVEITVANIDGMPTVYSVYFINDSVSTPEGIKISDSKEDMIAKYGTDYEEGTNQYTYSNGNVVLRFVVNGDEISGIEYTLITE